MYRIKNKAEEYEYEVQLRLQFEAKLNSMHSAHRMVEGDLKTTREKLLNVSSELDRYRDLHTELSKTYQKCKVDKEQLESQMGFKEERISGLIRENTLLQEALHEYEERVNIRKKKNKETVKTDEKTGRRISVEQAIKELHSIARIGEDPENKDSREHLKKYLPDKQIEIYESRYNELNKNHLVVLEELNGLKSQGLGYEEIIKERDERIAKINGFLEDLRGKII